MTRLSNYGDFEARKVEPQVDIALANLLFVPLRYMKEWNNEPTIWDGFHPTHFILDIIYCVSHIMLEESEQRLRFEPGHTHSTSKICVSAWIPVSESWDVKADEDLARGDVFFFPTQKYAIYCHI